MNSQQTCFTSFKDNIESYALPERFTFPFYYEPHPLCLLAAQELQQQLQNYEPLQLELEQTGKMFGVLLVENSKGEAGYLSAFSGKLNSHESSHQKTINFVPPVFDVDAQTDFFHEESSIINRLNSELDKLLANPFLSEYQHTLELKLNQQDEQLDQHRNKMAFNRKIRKEQRSHVKGSLEGDDLAQRLKQLAQESIDDKNQLRDLKEYWHDLISQVQQKLNILTAEIDRVKKTRKQLSTKLQKKLFKQYRLLNSAGIEKDLIELFQNAPYPIPPAGTGDCAAPKLLQYAFKQNMKPLAIAEFWWGQAPKSEIRQHRNFYGACSGKCQPILVHMLDGMDIDDNPLLVNPAEGKALEIIYQDDDIVVVNKPSEFLSVPGKNIEDSVYSRIKEQFPQATGSYIVHRLDMSTSGVMVLALTKRAQKNIQQQFVNRTIKKRYVAILEGKVEGDIGKAQMKTQGEINLPLRGDFEDRPKQLVCFEHGRNSKTQWEVIEIVEGKSKLYLYPETGRTHQLRVHCAHPKGLNMPILGDDLYGSNNYSSNTGNTSQKKPKRLHLHAQMLTLSHPVSKEVMTFEVDEEF
ncbi:RluA family pseudouridine synthase [Candidatus Colwellia aromaticivorans]|uniref:RluA family pseudouridine synthase n=1 Tax=Candidatus Colwellia aromaticivorans TaxID=2267621 RepID=UPI000DF3C36A|nr:RluA family pseudouridine synthase [Candidatus Colwellia aromaticivorans]